MHRIVPRPRLLVWTGAVILPITLVMTVQPMVATALFALILAFAFTVAADALLAGRSLDGIGLELPAVARMSKDRSASLDVWIDNTSERGRALRIALGLPQEVRTEAEVVDALLPAKSIRSKLVWHCTPVKRGRYLIRSAYIEGTSSLGFWAARRELAVSGEIRVYPNLLDERKRLAPLFLNRGAYGMHAQRQIGKGRDFEKLREYSPGDSFDEIHWKATARRAKPVTKVYQIERTQEVYVVIDASRLSGRRTRPGVNDSSVFERLVTAALVLGLAAERQGDLFGVLTFADSVGTFVRARNGSAHYNVCRDALYTLQPRSVTPDFDELCTFIRLHLRRRALVLFLTSLDDPALAESFVRNIDLVRKQHMVLVNMIRQPGDSPVFADSNVASIDDVYTKLGGHMRWSRLRQLQKVLERRGVRLSQVEDELLCVELVSQYLNVKQRQLL